MHKLSLQCSQLSSLLTLTLTLTLAVTLTFQIFTITPELLHVLEPNLPQMLKHTLSTYAQTLIRMLPTISDFTANPYPKINPNPNFYNSHSNA